MNHNNIVRNADAIRDWVSLEDDVFLAQALLSDEREILEKLSCFPYFPIIAGHQNF